LKNRFNDNGTYLKTGERKIFISQSLIDLYDDYVYEIIDELSICSDYLFVKISKEQSKSKLEINFSYLLIKNIKLLS